VHSYSADRRPKPQNIPVVTESVLGLQHQSTISCAASCGCFGATRREQQLLHLTLPLRCTKPSIRTMLFGEMLEVACKTRLWHAKPGPTYRPKFYVKPPKICVKYTEHGLQCRKSRTPRSTRQMTDGSAEIQRHTVVQDWQRRNISKSQILLAHRIGTRTRFTEPNLEE